MAASSTSTSNRTRVRPSVWVGVLLVAVYIVVLTGLQSLTGVAYDEIAGSTGNIVRVTFAEAGGAVILLAVWAWFGWGRQVWEDRPRLPAGWSMRVPVVLAVAMALLQMAGADWAEIGGGFVLAVAVFTLFVGLTEELLTRGLLLVAVRRGTGSEVATFFLSCLLFGLMHGLNILQGAEVGATAGQIVAAMFTGGALYFARRWSGSLVLPILVHALWDFSLLVQGEVDAQPETVSTESLLAVLVQYAIWISVIVGAVMVVRTRQAAADVISRQASAVETG